MQLNLNCLLCNLKQVLTVSSLAGADEKTTGWTVLDYADTLNG